MAQLEIVELLSELDKSHGYTGQNWRNELSMHGLRFVTRFSAYAWNAAG